MLLGEITTLYYEFHTKPTDTLCGENVDIFYAKSDSIFADTTVSQGFEATFSLWHSLLEYNKGHSGNSF
jgi:hypothetical protein